MSEEIFQVVTRRKWIARKSLKHQQTAAHKIGNDNQIGSDGSDVNIEKFAERLHCECEKMQQSEYFTRSIETLHRELGKIQKTLLRIVCFGLGSFTQTYQSLHQIAFILCIRKSLKLAQCIFFDPVFSDVEKQLIARFGGEVMPTDCEGQHKADIPTLYYLPHCPYALCHNIVYSNWNEYQLPNVILISNSFEMLTLSMTRKRNGNEIIENLQRIIELCTEVPLGNCFKHLNVFNDLSLHVFPSNSLAAAANQTTDFWTHPMPLKVEENE